MSCLSSRRAKFVEQVFPTGTIPKDGMYRRPGFKWGDGDGDDDTHHWHYDAIGDDNVDT